jgi:hypothetical protein
MPTDRASKRLLNEQKKVVETTGMLRMRGLVEFPKTEGFDEDLKATDVGSLLREMRDQVPPADGPYGEHAHRIGAIGHPQELVILLREHERGCVLRVDHVCRLPISGVRLSAIKPCGVARIGHLDDDVQLVALRKQPPHRA